MINSGFFLNILRFILLVLTQVMVFNNLNFFGFINPLVYILFLYWYPVKQTRTTFLAISFLLGLCVDIFSDTVAINAAASVTGAYFRPVLMRFIFGVNYDFQSFKLRNTTKAQQFTFLLFLISVHHFTYFTLEIFSLRDSFIVLKRTLVIVPATLLFCTLFISLFSTQKE